MQIAVFISGDTTEGINSPSAGEGRAGWGWADMLASFGHQVDCIGDNPWSPPSWGKSTPIWGINLTKNIYPDKVYDLVIYLPWEHARNGKGWEPCYTNPIRSKWYLHVQFGWAGSVADHICHTKNHALVYPYTFGGEQFHQPGNPFKTFPLPIPLYKSFPEDNLSNRKDILWATKDVFHNDWARGHHVPRIGFNTLKAIKRLSEKHNFNLYCISTNYFDPAKSWSAAEYNIPGLLASIPNVQTFQGLVPRNQLIDLMNRCRLNTIVSGLCGSFLESIPTGCLPLAYDGHLWKSAFEKQGLLLNTYEATEDQIYNVIEKLYTNDELWRTVLSDARSCIKDHSYEASYGYFQNICKELNIGY